jgi:hypothetical protein
VGWFGVVGTDADRPTITDLLAAWNGAENSGVRDAMRPPRGPVGPFPVLAAEARTTAAPQGPYEVHVGAGLARTSASMHVGASTDVRSAPRALHHPDGTLSLAPHEPAGS